MKKLVLNRKNDFVSAISVIDVKVNGEMYKLYSDTELLINLKDDHSKLEIEIKYLFFKRKYEYRSESSDIKITISPLVSNHLLIYSMTIFLMLLLVSQLTKSDSIALFFKLYGITWVFMFFFITTIGGKFFYKVKMQQSSL